MSEDQIQILEEKVKRREAEIESLSRLLEETFTQLEQAIVLMNQYKAIIESNLL